MGGDRDIIDLSPQDGNVLRFTVPGPVRGKGRPRFFVRKGAEGKAGHVGTFTDNKTASYENLIKLAARDAGARPLDGPLVLIITVFLSPPKSASKAARARLLASPPIRKPDQDNVVKAVMDGLNKIAWRDDVQVVDGGFARRWADAPGLVVTVKPWRPA